MLLKSNIMPKTKMSERDIQYAIVTYLTAIGCLVIRQNAGLAFSAHGSRMAQAPNGTPDLLVVLPDGKAVWVEVKSATGKLNSNQKAMHERLRAMGQTVIVAKSLDDVKTFLFSLKWEVRPDANV